MGRRKRSDASSRPETGKAASPARASRASAQPVLKPPVASPGAPGASLTPSHPGGAAGDPDAHPLTTSEGRQDYICEQLDMAPAEMSKSEKAAADNKRMWMALLREERKEAEQLARIETLTAELAEMRSLMDLMHAAAGAIEPPSVGLEEPN